MSTEGLPAFDVGLLLKFLQSVLEAAGQRSLFPNVCRLIHARWRTASVSLDSIVLNCRFSYEFPPKQSMRPFAV